MTNPESKQQYEGAILNQLVKNAEKLAVIEFDLNQIKPKVNKIDILEQKIDKIYSALGVIKWILATIGLAIIANIFSQPINNWLF